MYSSPLLGISPSAMQWEAMLYQCVSFCSLFPRYISIAHNEIDLPSISSTIGRAAIVILVMFSFPLQVHPCRASVDAVLRWRPKRSADSANGSPSRSGLLQPPAKPSGKPKGDGMGETRFAAITTGIIIFSYIVAMTVSSLEKVLAYVGSTGSTTISFILPVCFTIRYRRPSRRIIKS